LHLGRKKCTNFSGIRPTGTVLSRSPALRPYRKSLLCGQGLRQLPTGKWAVSSELRKGTTEQRACTFRSEKGSLWYAERGNLQHVRQPYFLGRGKGRGRGRATTGNQREASEKRALREGPREKNHSTSSVLDHTLPHQGLNVDQKRELRAATGLARTGCWTRVRGPGNLTGRVHWFRGVVR